MSKTIKKEVSQENQAISAAIDLLVEQGVDLSTSLSEGGILKQLTKRLVERALQSETDNRLGYTKYERVDKYSKWT